MKATQLIKELEELIKLHGDLEMFTQFWDEGDGYTPSEMAGTGLTVVEKDCFDCYYFDGKGYNV